MRSILFLCIGNSNIVGDSLGPLIGSFLQNYREKFFYKVMQEQILKNTNIEILGTMEKPIGYKKINNVSNIAMSKRYDQIYIIDSALGNEKNIGKILINNKKLSAGKGVNIGKTLERRCFDKRHSREELQ